VNGTTDNSNTHFATLALWAARKHDVPTERSFTLLVRRFRTSQGGNGTWAYHYVNGGANGAPAMTCVALLGLAIGHATGLDTGAAAKPEQDPQIIAALKALSGRVGTPAGSAKEAGGLYYLWAMERIAVLFDLRTFGNKDWYRWGVEVLLKTQSQDGSWPDDGGYPGQHPVLNTCFALMFLKRANLTPDLSRRFAVDSAALTSEVTPTPAPKPELPSFKFPSISLPSAPAEEPRSPATPLEQPSSGASQSPTQSAVEAPPQENVRPVWPWIVAALVLLVAVGVAGFFAIRAARSDREEDEEGDDEQPRKKGGSRKSHPRK
jgi:hypothetical protein